MSTTKRNQMTKNRAESLEWLLEKDRSGTCRIEKLSWRRLSRIYSSRRSTPEIREAIEEQARRLGYAPQIVLQLHQS